LKNHSVVKPQKSQYGLEWDPEPFIAVMGDNGIVPITEVDASNPKHQRLFIAMTISKVQFERHASYAIGGDYKTWQLIGIIAKEIYLLMEDGDDAIYCVGDVMNTLVLFGKLKSSPVLKKAKSALKAWNPISANISVG